MNTEDLAETIAVCLVCLLGLALFVWSWAANGSFVAALVITVAGGFFGLLLIGPLVAGAAFVFAALTALIRRA